MSCRRRRRRTERARPAGDTQDCSFTHDDLGRLASVNCGSEWSQTFSNGAHGNVEVTSGNDAFPASFPNNRISSVNGFAPNYDADGNLLDNPVAQTRNVYAWNANGRPVTVDGVSQTFDAFGRLVYNTAGPRQVVWTPDGYKAAVMNGQALTFALVPLPGGAVANFGPSGISYYAHPDWEGSWRLASSPSRTETGDLAYSPYGATYAGSGPDAFTGQWVDTPDNLNDFPARFLQPMMARWLSPDPAGIAAVNPANPQSWNAYAYVGDTPLEATDPLGLSGNDCGPAAGTQPSPTTLYTCDQGGEAYGYQIVDVSSTLPPGLALLPPSAFGEMGTGVGEGLGFFVNQMIVDLSQHPNGPGPSGSWNNGSSAGAILTVGPTTATPWYKDSCITSAIGAGALKAGVDAIGLIPEAGGVARIIGHQAGYVGVVADQFGANILGAVGHTGTAVDGLVNAGDTTPQGLLSTGLTIAGFIPGAGDVAAVASIGLDLFNTAEATSQCP